MVDDSKFGMQVGGVMRTQPVRRVAASTATPVRTPAAAYGGAENLPVTRLARIAGELAAQPVPVDPARVAALRNAIADNSYTANPAIIAKAMLRHVRGEGA